MKRPNFLFLFPDQHRGDWLPFPQEVQQTINSEQLPIRMPNVESLMQEGVTFTKAITPSPLCAPARACLAAGLRYHQCRVDGNYADYPLEQKTFYNVLKESGYRVGGVGKFDLHKATQWWGLNGWIDDLNQLGFTDAIDNAGKIDAIVSGKTEPKDPYMKFLYDSHLADIHIQDMTGRGKKTHPTELPEDAYCDNWLSNNGIQMLKDFPNDQPWFLVVNFTGPHGPFDITKSMKSAWENIEFPLPKQSNLDPAESVAIRQNYGAMLENIDRNIGRLLEEVKQRGEWDNTYVIYTSDHGEMLGDWNKYGKCRPERGAVHIPLVIKGPGIQQGIYSEALVELQDLAATIVELAGTSMEEAVDSFSLHSVLTGEKTEHRPYQISTLGEGKYNPKEWKMIADDQYKLILTRGENARLYDLKNDPWETSDMAGQAEEVVQRLTAELECQCAREV